MVPRGARTTSVTQAGACTRSCVLAEPRTAHPSRRWLCGTFTIGDPQASHLLASLPAVIILRGARGPAFEGLEGLEVARRMLVFEMQSPSQGSAGDDRPHPRSDLHPDSARLGR
jgi:hypothetical protein